MKARLAFLACGVLGCIAILGALQGFGRPGSASSGEEPGPQRSETVVARAGEATAEARVGDDVVVSAGGDEARRDEARRRENGEVREGRAVLRVLGEPGTEFTGTCAVGDEEREVSGEVPRRFVFDLGGRELACEISNESGGRMRVVLVAGENRIEQETSGRGAEVEFRFSGDGVSTASSSGSSGVVSQSSSSSVTSSSSVSHGGD